MIVNEIQPSKFEASTTFFVPLTLFEKQFEQEGAGFGGNAEIDAHIQLLRSPQLNNYFESLYTDKSFKVEVNRTRYGAVELKVVASDPEFAVELADKWVIAGDSLKKHMLIGNRKETLSDVERLFQKKKEQVDSLQHILDSLRMLNPLSIKEDAYTFRIETLYGSAVNDLAYYQSKAGKLKHFIDSPAPKAYLLNEAKFNVKNAKSPSWVIGVIGLLITFIILVSSKLILNSANEK
ncbi:MAG: hypothetical protein EA358_09345 [Flavobacteriales bacterium]|nr:MAG: hypothetical protein EA358_09345 [Flavobacteriales bacterium]